jgi:hypothetical protein
MKRHLTEDEIGAFVAGDSASGTMDHLAECAECRRQTAELQGILLAFRESATKWATAQQPAIRVPEAPQWWQPRPRWALAVVALALLTAIPAYRHFTTPVTPIATQELTTYDREADTALLKQVDAEISRSVPAPMEPLLTLVQGN